MYMNFEKDETFRNMFRPSAHGKTVLQREFQMSCVRDCYTIGLQSIYVFSPHTSSIEF